LNSSVRSTVVISGGVPVTGDFIHSPQNLSRFIELAEASVLPRGLFAADSVSAIGIKQTTSEERGFNFCDWWTVNSSLGLVGVPVTVGPK
jgi:hypothetical protein